MIPTAWITPEYERSGALDPQSQFLQSKHSYLLLTFRKTAKTVTAELKSLDGGVLDRRDWPARPGA